MANKRLIDANKIIGDIRVAKGIGEIVAETLVRFIEKQPTVDAVEVPDKELLKAIKLLIKQYGHSKQSEYVHSPVAHALYYTWKQMDERRGGE